MPRRTGGQFLPMDFQLPVPVDPVDSSIVTGSPYRKAGRRFSPAETGWMSVLFGGVLRETLETSSNRYPGPLS